MPIDSAEAVGVAQHLPLLSSHSGASVNLTSLPGAGLAVLVTGRPDQVSLAQTLLSTLRGLPPPA